MTIPALQIAFLTGQSDPRGAALSPLQDDFLDALQVPAEWKVRVNFPYPEATPPHREMPLLPASWHNSRQTLLSLGASFAQRHRPGFQALLGRAEKTLLLAGSCGLELLANLRLPASDLARLHVFAYGAVARRRPACDLRLVWGRRDRVARLLSRLSPEPGDAWVACGHLDYLESPDVRALCAAYVTELVPGISR